MPLKKSEFVLEDLPNICELSQGKASMLKETCIWCIDQYSYSNGTSLTVQYGKDESDHPVWWSEKEIDILKIRNSYNFDDAVEFGAEALALFVAVSKTKYDKVERSTKTTGIDYWLGYRKSDPNLPFDRAGRLEISGILNEKGANTLDNRIKTKQKQAKQSESTMLPIYVVVVAFNQFAAKMVVNDANSK